MKPRRQKIRFCHAHDGTRLAYATLGEGPPLVKASNWISHLEHDLASPVWGHLIEELSSRHTLVRYDQRGGGLSDWDVAEHGLEHWVRDLESVVDAAGLDRFPILGISQGAAIAAAYAVRHPERVTQLVVHGGFTQGSTVRARTAEEREEAELLCRLAEIGWGKPNVAWRQFFTTQFIPEGSTGQYRWFNELQQVSTSPSTAARMMRGMNLIDVKDLLSQVRCPTLVLHSTADGSVPFDQGRKFAVGIPDARFVPIESCNHLLLSTEPAWQEWVEEFRSFVPTTRPHGKELSGLTPRERDLLALIATGRDNAQIAATLALAEKTVRNHVTNNLRQAGRREPRASGRAGA